MLNRLIRRYRISKRYKQYLAEKATIADGDDSYDYRKLAYARIDREFFEDKKEIINRSAFPVGRYWNAIKCNWIERRWLRKERKLQDWVKYNTSAMLYSRNVVGSFDPDIMVGDNTLQNRVNAFYDKFDKAQEYVKRTRIRAGLRKP